MRDDTAGRCGSRGGSPPRRRSISTLLQRFVNFHYSVTLDLFGGEISSNAGSVYTGGLKGRYDETKVDDDHTLVAGGVRRAAGRERPDDHAGRSRR